MWRKSFAARLTSLRLLSKRQWPTKLFWMSLKSSGVTTSVAKHRFILRPRLRNCSVERRFTSSLKAWQTQARTKSTTQSASVCLQNAWAKSESSRRPELVSTVWQLPQPVQSWALTARFTWAKSMCAVSSRTLPQWSFMEPKFIL